MQLQIGSGRVHVAFTLHLVD